MLKSPQPPPSHAAPDLPLSPAPRAPEPTSPPPPPLPGGPEEASALGRDIDWVRMLVAALLCALVVGGAIAFEAMS